METLREAYALAKKNDGAPGVSVMSSGAIERQTIFRKFEVCFRRLRP
jgi:hypothetical protein